MTAINFDRCGENKSVSLPCDEYSLSPLGEKVCQICDCVYDFCLNLPDQIVRIYKKSLLILHVGLVYLPGVSTVYFLSRAAILKLRAIVATEPEKCCLNAKVRQKLYLSIPFAPFYRLILMFYMWRT